MKIRTSYGPAKRTDAPPALTFGLPGKQKVKPGPPARNLIRLLKDLPVDRSNSNKELLRHGDQPPLSCANAKPGSLGVAL